MSTQTVGKLTPEASPKKWLKENQHRYSISTLAKMLNKSVPQIEKMLLSIGFDVSLSKEHEALIRDEYQYRTVDEIVEMIARNGESKLIIRQKVLHFIKKKGLQKYGVIPMPETCKPKLKRAKADHQNVNHEDRVSFWLQMNDQEIKNHKGRINY